MKSKERMGYSQKLHFFNPCNNILLIIMIINNLIPLWPHFVIGYIQNETDVRLNFFLIMRKPTLILEH